VIKGDKKPAGGLLWVILPGKSSNGWVFVTRFVLNARH